MERRDCSFFSPKSNSFLFLEALVTLLKSFGYLFSDKLIVLIKAFAHEKYRWNIILILIMFCFETDGRGRLIHS